MDSQEIPCLGYHPTLCHAVLTFPIEGNMLADKPVTFSVPQGSVAGPILFNYYVGSLSDCIKHDGVLINGFADDHTLHNSYQAGDISAEINSSRILEDSLCSVNDWMG